MLESALERDSGSPLVQEDHQAVWGDRKKRPDDARTAGSDTRKRQLHRSYIETAAAQGLQFSLDGLLVVIQEQKHGSNWVIPRPVDH